MNAGPEDHSVLPKWSQVLSVGKACKKGTSFLGNATASLKSRSLSKTWRAPAQQNIVGAPTCSQTAVTEDNVHQIKTYCSDVWKVWKHLAAPIASRLPRARINPCGVEPRRTAGAKHNPILGRTYFPAFFLRLKENVWQGCMLILLGLIKGTDSGKERRFRVVKM